MNYVAWLIIDEACLQKFAEVTIAQICKYGYVLLSI